MPDPAVLSVDIGGTDDVQKKFDAMVAGMAASVDQLNAAMAGVTEGMGTLGETIEKLGASSQEAGQHIKEMGSAGGAAAASFKLLQTSVTGAIEILAGGGLRAGVGLMRELGEATEATAGHFGKIGEEIGKAAVHFGVFAAGMGTLALGGKELADMAAEDTLQIHSLAEAMGVGEAQVLQLRASLGGASISMEELAVTVRTMSVRMQDDWAAIQRAVRDAALPIVQDQVAIKEAAMATAAAVETAATAQADAERAHAEAVVNASEAVIHAKEAEFDAQNKVADAQRAYGDAVVNANEAQLNYADAQKEYQYSGEDAWRNMKDAIDAVSDAERKAADAATAVQEALLSIDEAATSVRGAYVSLYAAQLQYREATGGGRITRAERRELRAEQAGVALESAEERARGAEFQYARTRRDAIPEAEERQARAERGVGAAREAEDKAQQRYAESATRAADKLEKSGSEAAAALERLAKAGLELQLAPQKAADERRQAQLDVEGALATVRKTGFDATMAAAKAEDALVTARNAEIAATNKAVDDLNDNINAVRQYLTTGKGPPGFDITMAPPQRIAQAAEFEAGGPGHLIDELRLLQKEFQSGRLSIERQFEGVMTAVGVPRQLLTTGTEAGRAFRGAFAPGAPPIGELPTEMQQRQGAVIASRVEEMERMETATKKADAATRDFADDLGTKLVPAITTAMNAIAAHPGEAAAAGAAATAAVYVGGAALTAAVTAALTAAFQSFFKGGATAAAGGFFELGAPAVARTTATGGMTTAEMLGLGGGAGAPAGAAGLFSGIMSGLTKLSTVLSGLTILATPALQGPTAFGGDVNEQMRAEVAKDNAERAKFWAMINSVFGATFGGAAPPAQPPRSVTPTPPEAPGAPEPPKVGEAQKPPTLTQVTIVGQTDPIPVDVKSMPADFRPPAAHGEEQGPRVLDDAAGRKGDDAAGHLDTAASKLNDVAEKLSAADKPAADVAGVLGKIQQAVEDLTKATKPGQGQQAAGLTDRQQSEQAQANRELTESQVNVNDAQIYLIRDQEELTKAQTELTQAQTELTQAQAEAARQIVLDKRGGFEPPKGGYVRGGEGQASGGLIFGAGGPTDDNIPIMASAGEYVVNAKQTSKHRSLLDMINSGDGIHFQLGGYVRGLAPGGGFGVPGTGMLQAGLTSNIGMGGGYMAARMMNQSAQTYEVDLRTDHGVFTVLATDDQMATLQQSSISSKIASTGVKPSWWS